MSAGTAVRVEADRFNELFGDREPLYQGRPKSDSEHCPPHCGHRTGRSWDTGAATHGGEEVLCCHCGATTELRYIVERRSAEGHGEHVARRQRVYADPPSDWNLEEPTP